MLRLATSLTDPAGGGGEVPTDCGRGHGPGPGSVCLVDAPSPPGSTLNWPACSAPPSTSPIRCRDEPTVRKAFASPPVAEIVAHSGDGIVDKGAEASAAMVRRLIVCCDGTWNTANEGVRADPCPTNVNQTAGRSRRSTGRNATTLLLRGGVGVDRWERLRRGAFGFGFYCAG